ncbi:hypothetical protein GZH49_40000 [Nocardia terpenica]|uniref:hypothetical protein n=1 Tax=Nocardia terpenica TaxID=455432 RepID=UPI002FDFFE1E
MPRDAWKKLPPGPQRLFFETINALWESQGLPSGHTIARALSKNRTTAMSQGTVNNMLSGPRLSNWDNTSALIRHLEREPSDFLPLWLDAKRATQEVAATTPEAPSPTTTPERRTPRVSLIGGFTQAGAEVEL